MNFKKYIVLVILCVSVNAFADLRDWQDVEINNGHLLIDVEIGGVMGKALLDTGATSMGVNIDFLEKHDIAYKKGRKIILQGLFGEKKTHQIRDLKVKLFGIQTPISQASPFNANDDLAMIIGLPFFKNFVIQIDYPNSRLKLLARESVDLKKFANVEMRHGNNRRSLIVTGILKDNKKVKLLFDTGSTSGLLFDRRFVDMRGWLEKYPQVKGAASGITKTVEIDSLILPYFKFGPYELADVQATIPGDFASTNIEQEQSRAQTGKRISGGSAYDGILGYDILKHFVVSLDAKTASMHIIAE